MTNQEMQDFITDGRARDAERRLTLRERIKKEFPDINIEGLQECGSLYGDYRIMLNNMEYLSCDGVFTFKMETDLAMRIRWAEEETYEIVETENITYFIRSFVDWKVFIDEFYTGTGTKISYRRSTRVVNESSKGHYIELKGKRHYVSFLNNK